MRVLFLGRGDKRQGRPFRDQIRQRKMDEELQNWLRQIRDEAYVELRLDES